MTRLRKIDFKRNPYRGIFAQVAREVNIHRNNVRKAYFNRNPRICKLVNQRIEECRKYTGA